MRPQTRPARPLRLVALLLAPLALAWTVAHLVVWHKARQASAAWQAMGEPLGSIYARFPPQPENGAASALVKAALPLGIPLAPYRRDDERRKTPEILSRSLQPWLHGLLAAPEAEITLPPPEVESFLAEHRQAIDDLLLVLRQPVAPRWPEDARLGRRGPWPSLLPMLRFQELLGARALLAARDGDGERALDELALAWRLNAGLYERPEVISVLFAISASRVHLGVLRRIDAGTPAWLAGREPLPARQAVAASQRCEATATAEAGRRGEREALGHHFGLVGAPVYRWQGDRLMAPYLRYVLLDAAARYPRLLVRLAQLDLCREPVPLVAEELGADAPAWNPHLHIPGVVGSFGRAARLELDLELTGRILELRAARSVDGRWPAALADATSAVCPDRTWVYQVEPDGSMRIALSGEPPWQPETGLVLPSEHRE